MVYWPELGPRFRAQAIVRRGHLRGHVSSVDLSSRPVKVVTRRGYTSNLIIAPARGAPADCRQSGADGHGVSPAPLRRYFFRGNPIAVFGGGDGDGEGISSPASPPRSWWSSPQSLRLSKIMQTRLRDQDFVEWRPIEDIKDIGKGEVTSAALLTKPRSQGFTVRECSLRRPTPTPSPRGKLDMTLLVLVTHDGIHPAARRVRLRRRSGPRYRQPSRRRGRLMASSTLKNTSKRPAHLVEGNCSLQVHCDTARGRVAHLRRASAACHVHAPETLQVVGPAAQHFAVAGVSP